MYFIFFMLKEINLLEIVELRTPIAEFLHKSKEIGEEKKNTFGRRVQFHTQNSNILT